MALSNLSGWNNEAAPAAACGTACGAGDKPAEKPAACGSACGAGDKPAEKPGSMWIGLRGWRQTGSMWIGLWSR